MHRLRLHLERRRHFGLFGQDEPEDHVAYAQQPARGDGEDDDEDANDDGVDVEVIGHAGAHAPYEGVA